MPRYLVVTKSQDGTTHVLADVNEELHAINHITDAVYTALVDGESMELVATRTEDGNVSCFAHLNLKMDEQAGKSCHHGLFSESQSLLNRPARSA
jgi:hypothetical protein